MTKGRLEGKVALVTGASRGIGKGIALSLAQQGYRVALAAKNKERLEETAQSLPLQPLVFSLDVRSEQEVGKAIQETIQHCGHIDVLVNAAGVLLPGGSDLSSEDFRSMIETNLLGAFYCIQAAAPHMKERRSGYIFNIASRAGKMGNGFMAGYCASKFGLMGLNDSLVSDLAQFGIKMTALCPGWVDTDMATRANLPPEARITVEDVVRTVHFLLSLSPNCCIRECVLECCKNIEKANVSPFL